MDLPRFWRPGPLLPKMDLPGFRQRNWTGSTFFPCHLAAKLDPQAKLDRVPCQKWTCLDFGSETGPGPLFSLAIRQQNWTGSTFFPCQKWTCLDFGSETGPYSPLRYKLLAITSTLAIADLINNQPPYELRKQLGINQQPAECYYSSMMCV